MIPQAIQACADALKHLPGIGPRNAQRIAFRLTDHEPQKLEELLCALKNIKNIERCGKCYFVKERAKELCGICANAERKNILAIVEKDTDLITLERTGEFHGTYLVLGELSRGMLDQRHKKRIGQLKQCVKNGENIKEILVAVGPHALGDMIFELIRQNFKEHDIRITRLARGIPTGADIEFADQETLKSALKRRGEE